MSSEESRDNFQEPIKTQAEQEVMKFRCVRPLCDNLKLILSMPELCDVTFLVGLKKVPVHGVKAILGTRSRYVSNNPSNNNATHNNKGVQLERVCSRKNVAEGLKFVFGTEKIYFRKMRKYLLPAFLKAFFLRAINIQDNVKTG